MKSQFKVLFPRAVETVYLDTAAEGLPAPGLAESFAEYCRDKSLGTPGRRRFHRVEAETASLCARLLDTSPENVTLLSNASEAFNVLAGSLEWKAGDRVIISDLEFPSNVYPWLRLEQMGVEVVVVSGEGGALRFEDIERHINHSTRLISLSLVSYRTGAFLDCVPRLSAEAHRVGAFLSIDATQALGRLPLTVEGVDYLMSSSFKWLLGPHGLGVVYVSPDLREQLNPRAVGWYSVRNCFTPDRFERYELKSGAACLASGMPNFPSLYALRDSLQFVLRTGIDSIRDRLLEPVALLRRRLAAAGLSLLTPEDPRLASGIVAFEHPYAAQVGSALEEEGVIVWAGDGRVRASLHLYNDEEDVDRYVSILEGVLKKEKVVHG